MTYSPSDLEGKFIINNDTRKLFLVEGVYESGDHTVLVGIGDDGKPVDINWTLNSSSYALFGE